MPTSLTDLLAPLDAEHLGMVAQAYHVADAPHRAACLVRMLAGNFNLQCSGAVAQGVIQRIVHEQPELITLAPPPASWLRPCDPANEWLAAPECVACHIRTRCPGCSGTLVRSCLFPTTCFTLALGKRPGLVAILECVSCQARVADAWRWDAPVSRAFPAGHHHPRFAGSASSVRSSRWFFAVPGHCYEVRLLEFAFRLMARGGCSATAFGVVYCAVWGIDDSLTHFVTRLQWAVLAWASLRLLHSQSNVNPASVLRVLRPHHLAKPLLRKRAPIGMSARCVLLFRLSSLMANGR